MDVQKLACTKVYEYLRKHKMPFAEDFKKKANVDENYNIPVSIERMFTLFYGYDESSSDDVESDKSEESSSESDLSPISEMEEEEEEAEADEKKPAAEEKAEQSSPNNSTKAASRKRTYADLIAAGKPI